AVAAVPDAGGQLHAWYIDAATGAPVGMIGAAPIADPYATSLWAVLVVRNLLDALASAHAYDAGAHAAGTIGDFVWPSQIQNYLQEWGPYVEGTVAALKSCAAAVTDATLQKQTNTNAYFLE